MPVAFQNVTVPLAQGVDTKSDPKQLPMGKLLQLTNATFRSPGRLRKRPGHSSITGLSSGVAAFTLDDQLIVHDGTLVYSRATGNSTWSSVPQVSPAISVSARSLSRTAADQLNPDMAVHAASGITYVAWEQSDIPNVIHYAVIDTATGAHYQFNAALNTGSNTVFAPKLLPLGQYVIALYRDGSTLKYLAFDTTTPSVSPTVPVTVGTMAGGAPNYDATVIGSQIVVAFNSSSAGNVACKTLSSSLVLSSATNITGTASGCVTVFADSLSNRVVVAWYDGSVVKVAVRSSDLSTQVLAPTTVETQASAVTSITGVSAPGASSLFYLWWWVSGGTGTPIRASTVTAYSPAASTQFLVAVRPGAKAFWMSGGAYLPILYAPTSSLQPTYFVAAVSGQVVAKMLALVAGPNPSSTTLPESIVSGSTVTMALTARDLQTGSGLTTVGMSEYTLTFGASLARVSGVAGSLLWSGGILWQHDGVAPVEHGFHLFPEFITRVAPSDTGTNAYSYSFTYEWMDNKGNVHRSAPSVAVTQKQNNAIDGSHTIQITGPFLPITAKTTYSGVISRSDVVVTAYRTLANGSIFLRHSSFPNQPTNTATWTFTDAVTDATIQANAQLYTTGGVLENIAANSLLAMTQYADRVVGIDAESPLVLWRSQQIVPGSPVEFSDVIKLNLDTRLKAASALAVLDDKLIVFGASSIAVITGQGPDRTGANDDMTSGYVLPSDVGCIDPRSIVQAASGIGFKSSKGYYLLDRSLNVNYIGAEVETYNASTIVGALIDPARTQARLMLSTGTELVYDDRQGQWGIFTPENSGAVVDTCIWQGVPLYLKSDGTAHQETPGVFTDGGSNIALSFQTGWITFAGLSGFQRVRGLALLGDWISAHSLTVTVESVLDSYDSPVVDTYAITATTGPEQWRIPHLATQKVQAIRVTVTETPGSGEGLALSAISLEVGIKKGLAKLPATRSL